MSTQKVPRKKLMLSFFILQIGLGFIFLFNSLPFDYVLRIFGAFLVVISPLWLVLFRLFRIAKIRIPEKKEDELQKKKDDETL